MWGQQQSTPFGQSTQSRFGQSNQPGNTFEPAGLGLLQTQIPQQDSPDVEVNNSPTDTVSKLEWSPVNNHLLAVSWDKKAYVYNIGKQGESNLMLHKETEGPLLCCDWNHTGDQVFIGGGDKYVRLWDLKTSQDQMVAKHDDSVTVCKWIKEINMLVTASWDGKVNYWDCKQQKPALQVNCVNPGTGNGPSDTKGKIVCGDSRYPQLVFATQDNKIIIFDMRKPNVPVEVHKSSLKLPPISLRCTTQGNMGYAMGSTEARIALEYSSKEMNLEIPQKDPGSDKFTFRCHRKEPQNKLTGTNVECYTINDIAFHEAYGTFGTCGSDGEIVFWCKDSRSKLKNFSGRSKEVPVTAGAFNRHNTTSLCLFAYAQGYDWSMGYSAYDRQKYEPKIYLHHTPESQIKKDKSQKK